MKISQWALIILVSLSFTLSPRPAHSGLFNFISQKTNVHQQKLSSQKPKAHHFNFSSYQSHRASQFGHICALLLLGLVIVHQPYAEGGYSRRLQVGLTQRNQLGSFLSKIWNRKIGFYDEDELALILIKNQYYIEYRVADEVYLSPLAKLKEVGLQLENY